MKAVDFVAHISDMLGWGDVETIESDDATVRKILRSANLVLNSVQAEQNWKDLRVSGVLTTQVPVSLTTVACVLTKGNKTQQINLTAKGEDPDEWIGALIKLGAEPAYYRIEDVDSNDSLVLDRPYMGDLTTGNHDIYLGRDRYQLPDDYDRMVSKRLSNTLTGNDATLADETEIEKAREVGINVQEPTKYAIYGRSPRGATLLIFDTIPEEETSYTYEYQRNHPTLRYDNDEVLYPTRYQLSLVDQIVARLNRDVENQQAAMSAAQQALSEKVKQGAAPDSGNTGQRLTPWTGRGRRRG